MKNEDLRPYRKFGMSLLQMMALLGSLGILVTLGLSFFA